MRICSGIFLSLSQVLAVVLFCSTAYSSEGLEWGHFRVRPALSLSELYTDNVYQDHTDVRSDYITTLAPKLSLDFAFAVKNYITAQYEGEFRYYKNADNFNKDTHHAGLFWTWETPKGSTLKLGARADFDSIQPYSATDRHKDFVEEEVFAETLLKVSAITDLGLRYGHLSQNFRNPLDAINEFDRDTVTLSILYRRFSNEAFLLEYTYYFQNNNDLSGPSTDMNSHIIYLGSQWDPTAKLSGTLKMGYYLTKLEAGDNSDGFAMEADLTYRFSEITQFKAIAFRRLVRSSIAARETGDFYVSTGGSLSAYYSKWDPLNLRMGFFYTGNRFSQGDTQFSERKDSFYSAAIEAKHAFRERLVFLLRYEYRLNNSNISAFEYSENRGEARISFAL